MACLQPVCFTLAIVYSKRVKLRSKCAGSVYSLSCEYFLMRSQFVVWKAWLLALSHGGSLHKLLSAFASLKSWGRKAGFVVRFRGRRKKKKRFATPVLSLHVVY